MSFTAPRPRVPTWMARTNKIPPYDLCEIPIQLRGLQQQIAEMEHRFRQSKQIDIYEYNALRQSRDNLEQVRTTLQLI
jgi:hypothetical protein